VTTTRKPRLDGRLRLDYEISPRVFGRALALWIYLLGPRNRLIRFSIKRGPSLVKRFYTDTFEPPF